MKKGIGIITLLGLMIPTVVFGRDIKLVINNQQVKTQVAPMKKEGTTIVPLKVIATELGAKVDFDSMNQKVIVVKGDQVIELPIGKKVATVNGEQFELRTPVTMINGTTMIPVRFVAEHLDCTTGWDDQNHTVIITANKQSNTTLKSEIQPPKEYMDEAIKQIESKITFTSDIEVFTLYAFMNYTGYTDENNKQGFSPVRKSVLEDLNNMKLDLENESYYKDKEVSWLSYVQALYFMEKAPSFEYVMDIPNNIKALEDLPEHLQEFYEKVNIEELYNKYQKYYQEEEDAYKELVYPAIAKMNYYLKIDHETVEPFAISINLLDSSWRGTGLSKNKFYYNGMPMIITGPSEEPNIGSIVHEYLHGITTPIVGHLKETDNLSYLRKDVPKNSQADGYGDWKFILDESLVRGIQYKAVEEDARKNVEDINNREGFILSLYFYERFDEFETYEGSLEDFIKKLIIEYK